MTDQEIADALVKAGILLVRGNEYAIKGHFDSNHCYPQGDVDFVLRDWRVAGACLERMGPEQSEIVLRYVYYELSTESEWEVEMGNMPAKATADAANESLPRAICEAFVTLRDSKQIPKSVGCTETGARPEQEN